MKKNKILPTVLPDYIDVDKDMGKISMELKLAAYDLRCGKWQDVKFLKNPNSKRALGKITAFDAETGIATITLNKFGKKWKWEESLPKAFSCGYQPKQK